jgi:GNAT superfamily N-acetyltransferase
MRTCDIDTARAIERAECELLAESAAVAALRLPQVLSRPLSGGWAVFTEPGSPLDKLAGLGFGAELDRQALAEIERFHEQIGMPLQVEVSSLGDPSVANWLSAHGYRWVGVENVLGLELDGQRARPTAAAIDVQMASEGDFESWLDVLVAAFATPDADGVPAAESFDPAVLRAAIGDFVRGASLTRYVARIAGRTVGGDSMRTRGAIVQLCGAGTLPSERRQGVQSALLERRLVDARRAGCTTAVITVRPGSKSHENASRRGFALLYVRNIWRREPR